MERAPFYILIRTHEFTISQKEIIGNTFVLSRSDFDDSNSVRSLNKVAKVVT